MGISALLSAVCAAAGLCAPAAEQAPQLRLQTVARGLDGPVHVTAPPKDTRRTYIVEKVGRVRLLLDGRLRARPFLDIRGLVSNGGEQGLLSLAFHPSYAKNRRLYVNYTDRSGDTRVAEYRSSARTGQVLTRTRRQVFFAEQPYANHNGGQVAFGPDGFLYIGMGDGGSGGDPHNYAQNLRSPLGKLLRLNVNQRGAKAQIVGYGLRNPWRFSFDRANGDLYIGDVGQNAWEEVSYVPRQSAGLENYGWRVFEGNARFRNEEPSGSGRLVAPIAVYGRSDGSCSVTGGFVYRGSAVPGARGRYFYGDYCSGKVLSLKVASGRVTDTRREPFTVPGLSSFGENARGELYLTSLEGTVHRLAK